MIKKNNTEKEIQRVAQVDFTMWAEKIRNTVVLKKNHLTNATQTAIALQAYQANTQVGSL
jgi:hypothetical protein